ncbi:MULTISPECIES: hypothetical protein [unclassified Corynebacterium]|uniref:hypothetical protein n=1 Tax=unclassified Corynebacterium TaxID=2624378 RepID=UPI0029C9DCC5|nr:MULTISPECIES: hypothetical protein [unclassified Corynebacterium]WPF66559.1 hypothetical protein OLX12_02180 [Corynebacterium sp. 22KM0430]WPF69048.1 hypothetical protein OLW90_02175 [Corynebacterium sp. 21KM1197]
MISETAVNRTFDATYSERFRLLESDPERYFREYPVKPLRAAGAVEKTGKKRGLRRLFPGLG